jgi:hypothetical protein
VDGGAARANLEQREVGVGARPHAVVGDVEGVAVGDAGVERRLLPKPLEPGRPLDDARGAERTWARIAPAVLAGDALLEIAGPDRPVSVGEQSADPIAETALRDDLAVAVDDDSIVLWPPRRPVAAGAREKVPATGEWLDHRKLGGQRDDGNSRRR